VLAPALALFLDLAHPDGHLGRTQFENRDRMNPRFAQIRHDLKLRLLAAKYLSEIVQLWHDGAGDQMPCHEIGRDQ
jgi:hypothetical protein